MRIGRMGSMSPYSYYSDTMGLAPVSDPEATMANITRQEYMDFQNNFGQYEKDLIDKARNDTSLIDAARTDSAEATKLAEGINERILGRYGASVTPAQRQAMERSSESASTLGGIQAVNDAKMRQKDLNEGLAANLISIGQGVNVNAQQMMGTAASAQAQRNAAYESAKAANKAATYQTVGTLASTAILIAAFSDRRLKHDIKKVGVSESGVNIYEFNYTGAEGRYQGVMAAEVPWATVEADNGYMKVDYSKVDVEFKKVA